MAAGRTREKDENHRADVARAVPGRRRMSVRVRQAVPGPRVVSRSWFLPRQFMQPAPPRRRRRLPTTIIGHQRRDDPTRRHEEQRRPNPEGEWSKGLLLRRLEARAYPPGALAIPKV